MIDLRGFLSELIFPEKCTCIICGKEMPKNDKMLCEECASELIPMPDFRKVGSLNSEVDDMKVAFEYRSVSYAVARIKNSSCGYTARQIAAFLPEPPSNVDIVTCVPILKQRYRKRGYNQSHILAKEYARIYSLPYYNRLLTRSRLKKSQKALSTDERSIGQKSKIAALHAERAYGKNVLVIDDVITTGNTSEQCADVLKECGAKSVYVYAFAYDQ